MAEPEVSEQPAAAGARDRGRAHGGPERVYLRVAAILGVLTALEVCALLGVAAAC